jgi:hypothetical protein
MRFKTAKEAIDWYAHRKSNPAGEISTTEACIAIIKGDDVGSGQGYNPNALTYEDELIAMCDIDKMLDKFPPFLKEMLLVWGVDGEMKYAIDHGRKANPIFRRKSDRQQYNILNEAILKFERILGQGEYLYGRHWREVKKFSKAS